LVPAVTTFVLNTRYVQFSHGLQPFRRLAAVCLALLGLRMSTQQGE
jgi:hypothetical protein